MPDKKMEHQLEEAYKHIKPYMDEDEMLKKLCLTCPYKSKAKSTNYEFCKDKPCFQCYLAYVYLDWCNTSDGY